MFNKLSIYFKTNLKMAECVLGEVALTEKGGRRLVGITDGPVKEAQSSIQKL